MAINLFTVEGDPAGGSHPALAQGCQVPCLHAIYHRQYGGEEHTLPCPVSPYLCQRFEVSCRCPHLRGCIRGRDSVNGLDRQLVHVRNSGGQ